MSETKENSEVKSTTPAPAPASMDPSEKVLKWNAFYCTIILIGIFLDNDVKSWKKFSIFIIFAGLYVQFGLEKITKVLQSVAALAFGTANNIDNTSDANKALVDPRHEFKITQYHAIVKTISTLLDINVELYNSSYELPLLRHLKAFQTMLLNLEHNSGLAARLRSLCLSKKFVLGLMPSGNKINLVIIAPGLREDQQWLGKKEGKNLLSLPLDMPVENLLPWCQVVSQAELAVKSLQISSLSLTASTDQTREVDVEEKKSDEKLVDKVFGLVEKLEHVAPRLQKYNLSTIAVEIDISMKAQVKASCLREYSKFSSSGGDTSGIARITIPLLATEDDIVAGFLDFFE